MMKNADAKQIAMEVVGQLEAICDLVQIGGSIRRGKDIVKDAEVICIPDASFKLNTIIWNRIQRREWTWATYPAQGGQFSCRRGPKYYGVMVKGLRCEIFTATEVNWGYILWLRTGPGDANTWIMSHLNKVQAPIAFGEGLGWCDGAAVRIPDENALFALLGMPYIEPQDRSVATYRRYLEADDHQWGIGEALPTEQKSLF